MADSDTKTRPDVSENTRYGFYSKSKMVQPLYSEQYQRGISLIRKTVQLFMSILQIPELPVSKSADLLHSAPQRQSSTVTSSVRSWKKLTLILWQTNSSVENKLFTSIAQLRSTCCNSTLQCRLKWDPSRRESRPEQRMLDGSVDKKVKLFTSIAQLRYAV